MIIGGDGPTAAPNSSRDQITETITINLTGDTPVHQHKKILRQVANVLHALMSNGMRFAAIDGGDGRNAGASFQIYQQVFGAAANVDAAAMALEQGGRKVVDPRAMGVPPGFGRA